MVIVIADDFTGAAEIGGIGLRYGMDATIQREYDLDFDRELVIIDTDTRSLTTNEAENRIKGFARQLKNIPIEWLYKKVDSVLRGHVLTELRILLDVFEKPIALLVPSNPAMGRIVSNGMYFIDGKLLEQTAFSRDAEFKSFSSDVLELLGACSRIDTSVLRRNAPIPSCGIAVGEASSKDDLLEWARRVDDFLIPAGAADFFSALLEVRGFEEKKRRNRDVPWKGRTSLFVSRKPLDKDKEIIGERKEGSALRIPISSAFDSLKSAQDTELQRVMDRIIEAYMNYQKVIVYIDEPSSEDLIESNELFSVISILVESTMKKVCLQELIVEGGATVSSVLRRLGWTTFTPSQELAPGVLRMGVIGQTDLYLTAKPGSYPWPKGMWS